MAKGKKAKEEPKVEAEVKEEPKVEAEVKEEPKVEAAPVIESVTESFGPRKVKVSPAELQKLQAEGKLIGWNPATSEALIK